MIKVLSVFDFDGTLVDSSHRYRTQITEHGERIDLQYWIENEHRADEDTFISATALEFQMLSASSHAYPVIATARVWCDKAQALLDTLECNRYSLVSRRDREDCRGGAALKIAGINSMLNLKQFHSVEAIEVYEDNIDYLKTLCDYYKERGFKVVGKYFPSNQGH